MRCTKEGDLERRDIEGSLINRQLWRVEVKGKTYFVVNYWEAGRPDTAKHHSYYIDGDIEGSDIVLEKMDRVNGFTLEGFVQEYLKDSI